MVEFIFRALFILSFIAMLSIRVYFQSKVLHERRQMDFREGAFSLTSGCIAALVTILFGAEYILSPGFFRFAYLLPYPVGLRVFGTVLLAGGITLLAFAHSHLGRSFHSLVVAKEDHVFVDTGPYQCIRHPIYTAYLMNYIGGGLLAGNWVLTLVPAVFFGLLVAARIGREEQLMMDEFGDRYIEYMRRTGRLLPKLRKKSQHRKESHLHEGLRR
jgi:protein-S-isoprenylcysteine O-methyltransferase Ste14